jgi:hypothetical protein
MVRTPVKRNLSKKERGEVSNRAKRKGASFERKVAHMIIAYFNGLEIDGIHFEYGKSARRQRGSGADRYDKLDILIKDPLLLVLFPFAIEAKAVERLDTLQVFNRRKDEIADCSLVSILDKAREEAVLRLCPLLVLVRKGTKPMVMISKVDVDERMGAHYSFVLGKMVSDATGFTHGTGKRNRTSPEFIGRVIAFTPELDDPHFIFTFDDFIEAVAPREWVESTYEDYVKLHG